MWYNQFYIDIDEEVVIDDLLIERLCLVEIISNSL